MADVLQKVISDKDFVNGACITTATPLSNTTKNRLAQKINDNTGIGSISGILDTRFDDSTYYSGDATASGGGGESSLPSIRSTTDTTNLPTGTVDGDLVIIMAMDSFNSGGNTITAPAGFSTLFNGSMGTNRPYAVFYKVASSEPSSYTIADATEVSVITIQDVAASPVHATDAGTIGTFNYTFTPLTLTKNNCLILYFCSEGNDNSLQDVASGPATRQIHRFTSSGNDRTMTLFTMDDLQDVGYTDEVVITRASYAGRFGKMAIVG